MCHYQNMHYIFCLYNILLLSVTLLECSEKRNFPKYFLNQKDEIPTEEKLKKQFNYITTDSTQKIEYVFHLSTFSENDQNSYILQTTTSDPNKPGFTKTKTKKVKKQNDLNIIPHFNFSDINTKESYQENLLSFHTQKKRKFVFNVIIATNKKLILCGLLFIISLLTEKQNTQFANAINHIQHPKMLIVALLANNILIFILRIITQKLFMDKNIKKIIRFYFIALATTAICSEKQQELNPLPLQIYYNFLNINTPEKYNVVNEMMAIKFVKNVIIECDMCNTKMTGIFSAAYKNMLNHRSNIHQVCKYNNVHETSNCISLNPLSQEILIAQILANIRLILNFSSIDTKEKYNEISAKLSQGKQTHVIIKCNKCPIERTGQLLTARSNMIIHRRVIHLICKCNTQYESITQIENCKYCNK